MAFLNPSIMATLGHATLPSEVNTDLHFLNFRSLSQKITAMTKPKTHPLWWYVFDRHQGFIFGSFQRRRPSRSLCTLQEQDRTQCSHPTLPHWRKPQTGSYMDSSQPTQKSKVVLSASFCSVYGHTKIRCFVQSLY